MLFLATVATAGSLYSPSSFRVVARASSLTSRFALLYLTSARPLFAPRLSPCRNLLDLFPLAPLPKCLYVLSSVAYLGEASRLFLNGPTYCKDKFDIHRYHEIRDIAAEMMAAGTSLSDPAPLVEIFAQQSGYATPRFDTRVAAFQDGRILLVRELEDGRWTLPGGWADVGEPPSVSAYANW